MIKRYLKPQTQVFDFEPEDNFCATSGRTGSFSVSNGKTMIKKEYLTPQTQVFDFEPEDSFCATSGRTGSSSDYDEDDEHDIFDD